MEYTNIAHIAVTESAANTLTFQKLETGISTNQKVGWLLHKLEYFMAGVVTSAIFDTGADSFLGGLVASNALTDLSDQSNPAILDSIQVRRIDLGTAASGLFYNSPIIKDFSMLPGGGLLVPPNPLYAAAKGSSLGAATTMRIRLYYSALELKTDDFWQLLEMYRLISS